MYVVDVFRCSEAYAHCCPFSACARLIRSASAIVYFLKLRLNLPSDIMFTSCSVIY